MHKYKLKVQQQHENNLVSIFLLQGMKKDARSSTSEDLRIIPRTMQFSGAHTVVSRTVSKLKQSTASYYSGNILT